MDPAPAQREAVSTQERPCLGAHTNRPPRAGRAHHFPSLPSAAGGGGRFRRNPWFRQNAAGPCTSAGLPLAHAKVRGHLRRTCRSAGRRAFQCTGSNNPGWVPRRHRPEAQENVFSTVQIPVSSSAHLAVSTTDFFFYFVHPSVSFSWRQSTRHGLYQRVMCAFCCVCVCVCVCV